MYLFYFISINFSLNSHMWSVAIILDNAVLEEGHFICNTDLCHSESSSCILLGSDRDRVSDHGAISVYVSRTIPHELSSLTY